MNLNPYQANSIASLAKRTFDLVVASTVFIVFLPFFIVISIAIKVSSKGPILFCQERYTIGGRKFILLKFRTMRQDAEEMLNDLKSQNEAKGPVFKIKNDPRVTPIVGTFLRWSNLDEIPQLLNVLRGDMSIVGPRPHEEFVVRKYEPWQRQRFLVKAGLTCTWQIHPDRHNISFEEWMQMDLDYIKKQSLWFDVSILLRTVKIILHIF